MVYCWFFFPRGMGGCLCSPGCPGTHSVDQDGLELRDHPAFASKRAGITGVRHHRLASLELLTLTPASAMYGNYIYGPPHLVYAILGIELRAILA